MKDFRIYNHTNVIIKTLTIFSISIFPYLCSKAQDSINIKFRSRALLDVSVSKYENNKTTTYYSLEDFRIGFKASYKNNEIKTDVGFNGYEWNIKDFI